MDIHAIDWNATPWERVRDGVERMGRLRGLSLSVDVEPQ